jgi:hypothetical protein
MRSVGAVTVDAAEGVPAGFTAAKGDTVRIRRIARAVPGALTTLLVLAAPGCSERLPAGPAAFVSPHLSPDFFAAAVRYFGTKTEAPIVVDPRPLRPESRLGSVGMNDLLPAETETIRMRTRVVESGGWRITDAPRDWGCIWSQALSSPVPRPVPDSVRLHKEDCLSRAPYQSLVFGLPQPGTDPDHPDRWRIRTMQMFTFGFQVVDLFLEASPNGGWTVVEERVRTGVFS